VGKRDRHSVIAAVTGDVLFLCLAVQSLAYFAAFLDSISNHCIYFPSLYSRSFALLHLTS
jgi:hypothetical protein